MKAIAQGMTHPGLQRPSNEDAFEHDTQLGFFAVADGMGGMPDGALASRMAIDIVASAFREEPNPKDLKRLSRLVRTAHAHVHDEGFNRHPDTGMGTTLTLATIDNDSLLISHVGDSAVFFWRKREGIRQLTSEHTLAALYRDRLPPGEKLPPYFQHTLTQCIGMSEKLEPEFLAEPLQPGDRILLCTDGVTKVLNERTIESLLTSTKTLAGMLTRLEKAVLEKGAPDNFSAVVIFMT